MLVTPFYNGQGLGNQLHNYVTVKAVAKRCGYEFGVMFPDRFKGKGFMDIDMGVNIGEAILESEGSTPIELPKPLVGYYREQVIGNGEYDQNIFNLPDFYMIHGNLQGEDYYKDYREEIKDWLAVPPIQIPDDLCIINFRGGEYRYVDEFFLPKSYWEQGIGLMKEINPNMRFEVHTDDAQTARYFFPEYRIIADIGINWRSIRYAKYLLISNSSFAFLPAWLNDNAKVIAPKFWGRRNRGYWFLEQNKTNRFFYI